MWIRSMVQQLGGFTDDFASHEVLKQLPQYQCLVREHNAFALEAATYEVKILKRWTAHFKVVTNGLFCCNFLTLSYSFNSCLQLKNR